MSKVRLFEEIQRRSLSFLTFFTAALIAVAILFSSFKSRETDCQVRAHELWYPILLQPSLSQADLFDAILLSLGENKLNVRLRVRNETSHSGTVAELDTSDHVIASQSLRFFQQKTADGDVTLHLREYSSGICASPFELEEALETNYNVDRESYYLTTVATKDASGSMLYFRQSTVRTNRAVDTYGSFQTRFPAFRTVSSSAGAAGNLQAVAMKFHTYCASPIIGPRGDTAVVLLVEGWSDANGVFQFWKLILKTNKISDMRILEAAYSGFLIDFKKSLLADSKVFSTYAQY